MTVGRVLLCVTAIASCTCGSYRDFILPRLEYGIAPAAFTWEPQRNPVLAPAAAGEWDSVDVLNPAIVRRGETYFNLYSGFDGKTWHTGLATSPDGILWARRGKILSPDPATWEGSDICANGTVVDVDGEFLYWYQAGAPHRIGLARSSDGRGWRKLPDPVIELGPRGSWDERAVADPYVIRTRGSFYMFYLGMDRAGRQRLGVATSADGVGWWKLRQNPVLELGDYGAFDERGLGEPAVWSRGGYYWMLYTGRDRTERRRIGMARSRDGVHWEKLRTPLLAGDEAWNTKVICDPEVEQQGDRVRVWFGGGDVAHPVENIHGRIGVGWLIGR